MTVITCTADNRLPRSIGYNYNLIDSTLQLPSRKCSISNAALESTDVMDALRIRILVSYTFPEFHENEENSFRFSVRYCYACINFVRSPHFFRADCRLAKVQKFMSCSLGHAATKHSATLDEKCLNTIYKVSFLFK